MQCRRLASAFLALVTAACSVPPSARSPDDAVVYVVGRGWHTDIGLPVEEIGGNLTTLETRFPGVRVLTFGFGERQFLVTRKRSFTAMLGALLPSRSAVLLTALRTTPQVAFGAANVVVLPITRAGVQRIESNIWKELELSGSGEPILLAQGPYPGSVFYAARDTYDGFYTCNTWTADTLAAGGLPIAVAGTLFSGQVMGMARRFAHHASLSPN